MKPPLHLPALSSSGTQPTTPKKRKILRIDTLQNKYHSAQKPPKSRPSSSSSSTRRFPSATSIEPSSRSIIASVTRCTSAPPTIS